MTNLHELDTWLRSELPALSAKHRVPGVAVAVSVGEDVVDLATGLLSKDTGVDATPDSVFQIGSITKVWTASLVMQLVDEGLVELDEPVQTYLPDFTLGDAAAAAVITVRELLDHTGGFEGDIFTDTGTGDDALEKFVALTDGIPQLFAPGERFSYNNAGYCVLGRLVEVLRDKTYDAALRDHLFAPLGLTHAATSAAEAIMFRAAIGHIQPESDGDIVTAPVWSMPRSNAPAGSLLSMRPRDLIEFARMHLRGGSTADGTPVLAAGTVRAMQERQVELPDLRLLGNAWGLGWELFDVPGGRLFGHDGSTVGQNAFLRVAPDSDVAVVLLTNGGDSHALYLELVGRILSELAGIDLPALPTPPSEPERVDAARIVGSYAIQVADIEVTQDGDGRIWIDMVPKGFIAESGDLPDRKELVHFEGDTFIPVEPDRGMHMPHAFVGDDGSGHAAFLHIGRAVPRVAKASA